MGTLFHEFTLQGVTMLQLFIVVAFILLQVVIDFHQLHQVFHGIVPLLSVLGFIGSETVQFITADEMSNLEEETM